MDQRMLELFRLPSLCRACNASSHAQPHVCLQQHPTTVLDLPAKCTPAVCLLLCLQAAAPVEPELLYTPALPDYSATEMPSYSSLTQAADMEKNIGLFLPSLPFPYIISA